MVKNIILNLFFFMAYFVLLGQSKATNFVKKGNEYLAVLNFIKAEECYNKALSIDSNCIEAYIQKSDIKIQKSEFEQALELIDFAKSKAENMNEKNETLAHIYSLRSFIYFSTNNYKNAIEDLNNAISLNDQNSGYFFMRALIRRMTSDISGCCLDLKKASSLGLDKAKESLSLYCK